MDKRTATKVLALTRRKYAPDSRTAFFGVRAEVQRHALILCGHLFPGTLRKPVVSFVNGHVSLPVIDRISVLPGLAPGRATRGIVRVSVANILKSPRHSSTLMTQALLGTPVTILNEMDGWYLIRLPDSYIGWVHESIVPMPPAQYREWERLRKIIITQLHTRATAGERTTDPVSDLVAGDVLALVNESARHYQLMYPDRRIGFCEKRSAMPLAEWQARALPSQSSIVATARLLIGVPYLWGGTSPGALDCSGLVKFVYFLNGVELPRDADQQARAGHEITPDASFSNVNPGDILYFAAARGSSARITHVGLSLGGRRFVEASGDVHLSSLDPADTRFVQKRAATLRGVRRVLP